MAPTFKIKLNKAIKNILYEQIRLCQLHRLDDIIGVLVLKFL